MSHAPDKAASAPAPKAAPRGWRDFRKPLLTLLAVGVMACAVWLVVTGQSRDKSVLWWCAQLVVPVTMLLLICVIAARHELQWKTPLKKLRAHLPLVLAGESAIESLAELSGPDEFRQLLPLIQSMLHDLRRQKVEVVKLEQEISARVANRTDALERALGSLRQQATRDALTGLGNRRMLDNSLPKLLATCREQRSELCLLMIDVDNFKRLNDTLGHAAGDQFLRDVGGLVRSTVRTTDLAFRLGGDEFVIVMPDATDTSADALSDRLISLLDAHGRTIKSEPRPRLSIGMARLSALPDATPEQLLEAADQKLYAIKATRKSANFLTAGQARNKSDAA